ncbi:hypothetical protein JCM10207_003835 [Rhodosporidiobolus poonsookiae]
MEQPVNPPEAEAAAVDSLDDAAGDGVQHGEHSAEETATLVTSSRPSSDDLPHHVVPDANSSAPAPPTAAPLSSIASFLPPARPQSAGKPVTDLERDLSVFKDVLAASERRAMGLQHSLEAAEEEIDARDVELSRLEAELAASQARERELRTGVDLVTAKAASQASRIEDLEDELREVRSSTSSALDGLRTEATAARGELLKVQAELQQFQAGKAMMENDVTKAKAKADMLDAQLRISNADLATAQGRVTTLQQQLNTAQADVERLTTSNDSLQSTNNTLSISIEELRTNLSTLSSSQSSLPDQAAALSSSLAQAQDSEAAMRRELEALRLELAEAERSKHEIYEELARCRGEVEETSSTLQAAMAELDATKDDVAELEKAVDDAREEITAGTAARLAVEQEKVALEGQVASLQARTDDLATSASSLEQQVSTLKRSLQDKEEAIEKLEAAQSKDLETANELARERDVQLKAAHRQASKTARELEAIIVSDGVRRSAVEGLSQAIARLEEEVGRLRPSKAATSSEADGLADELELRVNEVVALRQELEQQKEASTEANRALAELRDLFAQAQEEVEELRANGVPAGAPADAPPATSADLDNLRLEISSAQAKIRSLEQEVFSLDQVRVKMLKANGDLKSQVESMTEALDQERTRARAKELELEQEKSSASALSPAPRAPQPSRSPVGSRPPPPPLRDSTASPTPQTPTRRGHSHRRTASFLPSASDLTLPAISELNDPTINPPSILSPPLVPLPSAAAAAPVPSSAPSTAAAHRAAQSRHMRQASLSLLKQRMEDEYGVDDLDHAGPLSPSREGPGLGAMASPVRSKGGKTRRVPLSDAVVWCSCCEGDLFVL